MWQDDKMRSRKKMTKGKHLLISDTIADFIIFSDRTVFIGTVVIVAFIPVCFVGLMKLFFLAGSLS
jgi:hypothetical protein